MTYLKRPEPRKDYLPLIMGVVFVSSVGLSTAWLGSMVKDLTTQTTTRTMGVYR